MRFGLTLICLLLQTSSILGYRYRRVYNRADSSHDRAPAYYNYQRLPSGTDAHEDLLGLIRELHIDDEIWTDDDYEDVSGDSIPLGQGQTVGLRRRGQPAGQAPVVTDPQDIWNLIKHAAPDAKAGDSFIFYRSFPKENHNLFGKEYQALTTKYKAEHRQAVVGKFDGKGFEGQRIELIISGFPDEGSPEEKTYNAQGKPIQVRFDPYGFGPARPANGGSINNIFLLKKLSRPVSKADLEASTARIAPPGSKWSGLGGGLNCMAFVELLGKSLP